MLNLFALSTTQAPLAPQRSDVATEILRQSRVAMKVNAIRLSPEMTFGEASERYIDLYTLDLVTANYKAPRTIQSVARAFQAAVQRGSSCLTGGSVVIFSTPFAAGPGAR